MKNIKVYFFTISIILCIQNFVVSQSYIYTPTGIPISYVPRVTPPEMEPELQRINAADNIKMKTYGATRIAYANYEYNCHGYAWHMYDCAGTAEKVWLGTNDAEKYFAGSKPVYILDSDATFNGGKPKIGSKVLYMKDEHTPADHSAVVVSYNKGVTVRSKWSTGGLFEHGVKDCDWCKDSKPYYYILAVSGKSKLCDNESGTYTTKNISGATYTWSSDKINLSGSSYSVTGTKKNGAEGETKVSVSIYSPLSKTIIKGYAETYVGVRPVLSSISGPMFLKPNSFNVRFDAYPATTGGVYTWSITPAPAYMYNFSQSACFIDFTNIGYYNLSVKVTKTGACGGTTPVVSKDIIVYEGASGYFSLNPNPASSDVKLSITKFLGDMPSGNVLKSSSGKEISNTEVIHTIRIINNNGAQVYTSKCTCNDFTIPVESLKSGIYIVQVFDGKQTYTQQLVVTH